VALEFRPLCGNFGAEVVGADPALALGEDDFAAVEAAWYARSILLFRGLAMTPQQQIAFTRRLGPLHVMMPPEFNLAGHPEIFVVSNAVEGGRPLGLRRAGMGFHTDGEDKAVPNAGSFLYAREVPPEGGDTLFVDMHAVWEALPAEIRARIENRRARFSRAALHNVNYPHLPPLSEIETLQRPDVYHPLARRHPKSGRVALYIGRWACDIEGLPAGEGHALVLTLQEFAQQPRFQYRHRWRVGDAILWDNRSTQHSATPFDEDRFTRLMHRTTLEGEMPLMA
jgi:putative 2-oxoglutarate oxygenase